MKYKFPESEIIAKVIENTMDEKKGDLFIEVGKILDEKKLPYTSTLFESMGRRWNRDEKTINDAISSGRSIIKGEYRTHEFLFKDIADFEQNFGHPVNEAFKIGWDMARIQKSREE